MSHGAVAAEARARRRVRILLRNRERPAPGEVAYLGYLTIMVVIVVAAPIVRSGVLWLATVLPTAGDPLLVRWGWGGALLVLGLLPVVGWYTSPVRIPLPEIDLLFTTALPRWRLVLGRALRCVAFAVLLGTMVAGLMLSARAVQGEFAPEMLAPTLGFGAALGLCAGALLLLGQLIRGTRWYALREQAERLDAVSTLVATGEFRSAAGRIGAPVKLGRTWSWARRWASPRSPAFALRLMVSRDLLGIARTPLRSAAALLVTGMAGAASSLVFSAAAGGAAPLVGAIVLLAVYSGVGPWCRGLRAAAETIGAPAVFPFSAPQLLLLHLAVPTVLASTVCAGSAALTAFLLPGSTAGPAAFAGALLGVIATALRLLGALKGPLPQKLLAPVPTPAGDLAGANVMLWNLDGPILAALIGAALAAAAGSMPLLALMLATVVVAVLVLWSSRRLRGIEDG